MPQLQDVTTGFRKSSYIFSNCLATGKSTNKVLLQSDICIQIIFFQSRFQKLPSQKSKKKKNKPKQKKPQSDRKIKKSHPAQKYFHKHQIKQSQQSGLQRYTKPQAPPEQQIKHASCHSNLGEKRYLHCWQLPPCFLQIYKGWSRQSLPNSAQYSAPA